MASRNLTFVTVQEQAATAEPLNQVRVLPLTRPSIRIEDETLQERIFNVVGSSLLILAISPIFIVISLIVLIRSGRPLFYFQTRIGQGGREFKMIKFRTMVQNAHSMKDQLKHLNLMSGPFFKIKDDPRVTGVGRTLRRWSLDELPQLFNVFKGDMSLVGPRPMLPEEIERLNCRDILKIKPGITGLWQVSGRNQIVDFRRKLALDRLYVQRRSMWLNLTILARTLQAVVRGRGAY